MTFMLPVVTDPTFSCLHLTQDDPTRTSALDTLFGIHTELLFR